MPRIGAAVYNLQKVVKRVSSQHLDAETVATWWSPVFSLVKCSSLPGHVWFASGLRNLCPRYAAADTLDFPPKKVRSKLFFTRLPVERKANQARHLASQSDRREACEFLCKFVVLYSPEDLILYKDWYSLKTYENAVSIRSRQTFSIVWPQTGKIKLANFIWITVSLV